MDKSNVTQLHPKDKGSSDETFLGSSLSPREIVSELDRFRWELCISRWESINGNGYECRTTC